MSLQITRDGDAFWVSISPPEGQPWNSDRALSVYEAFAELEKRGCHSTDASDAMFEADRRWFQSGHALGRPWTEVHQAELRKLGGLA
jgi:hypothetical protein